MDVSLGMVILNRIAELKKPNSKQYTFALKNNPANIFMNFFVQCSTSENQMYPRNILHHLNQIPTAYQSDTMGLWCANLAWMIHQQFLNAQDLLSEDFKIYFGARDHQILLQSLPNQSQQHEFARVVCHEYYKVICKSIQNKFQHEDATSSILNNISFYFNQSLNQWDLSQINLKRFEYLKDQLKIDHLNLEHCQFWNSQVTNIASHQGGRSYILEGKTFYLPTRVHSLFTLQTETTSDNYENFLSDVEQKTRSYNPLLNFFQEEFKTRTEPTKRLYNTKDLQYLKL